MKLLIMLLASCVTQPIVDRLPSFGTRYTCTLDANESCTGARSATVLRRSARARADPGVHAVRARNHHRERRDRSDQTGVCITED